MDTGHEVLKRAVEDVLTGRLRWVARQPERHETGLSAADASPESRRERDRLRKAIQRARHSGKPT